MQPLDNFHRNNKNKTGTNRHSWCKDCTREYGREWRAKNATYYWDRYLNKRFGLPALDYDALLAAQDEKCAVCKSECKTGNRLAVDHDHVTGRIRGLLCLRCNTMLGQADDDPERLRAAARYLDGNAS